MPTYTNPGAIANVTTSTTIASNWGNAIRDRVVNNYATTSARTTDIASPVQGQTTYVTYAGTGTGLQVYAGATDGWQAPWNLPWGVISVADAGATTYGPASGGPNAVLTTTFTAIANRLIKVTVQFLSGTQVGAGNSFIAARNGGTTLKQVLVSTAAATNTFGGTVIGTFTSTAGSLTVGGAIVTTATTFALAAGMTVIVEDIGPSGNPS